MRQVIIAFEILLIMGPTVSWITGIYLEGAMSKGERYNLHMIYNYVNRSLFLIIFFKVLFAFKKVEL